MIDVAAIIVTRDRCELLLRSLTALRDQVVAPNAWFLVNNASTDQTLQRLASDGWTQEPRLHVLTLERNRGGAGGFCAGISAAYAAGHEWLWLMDDDCITQPTSLSTLLESLASFAPDERPSLLCSRVDWKDGSLHPLNVVAVKNSDKEFLYGSPLHQCLSIRAATFVSLLVHRTMVEKYGMPNAVYFLWLDDIEWTARILRFERGVLVPASRVVHFTTDTSSTIDAPPHRIYYYIRNSLWMLLASNCFSPAEKLQRGTVLGNITMRWLLKRFWQFRAWSAVGGAVARGFFPPLRSLDPMSRRAALIRRGKS